MKSTTRNINDTLLALLPLAALLFLWQFAFSFNWLPRWLLPSPANTASTFWQLLRSGVIVELIAASATNVIPPFFLAVLASLFVGSLIGLNKLARRILFPTLSAVYPVPSLAWLTLIVLFVGFNRQAIWAVVFVSSFFKMVYSVIGGVRSVESNWILAARNLGLGKMQILFHVILPGAFPQIITGLRLGFGSAWKSLISAEMLVSSFGGLGTFIWMSQWHFNFSQVIVGIAIIALIGFVMEKYVLLRLEKLTLAKWGRI